MEKREARLKDEKLANRQLLGFKNTSKIACNERSQRGWYKTIGQFVLDNKRWFDKIRVEDEETIMWNDLNLEQMEREENAYAGFRPPEEVEQIVIMVRLELYNRGLPCGPKALRRRLNEHEVLRPLPSERTIARILARNGLTYGRTGWYEGEKSEDMLVKKGGRITGNSICR